jgi:predicted porin
MRTDGNEFGLSFLDPNVINIFPEYNFRTASKWTTGLSYVFNKRGLISIDYSIQDHSNSTFRSNVFQNINTDIQQNLGTAANLNIGGEYVYKQLRFRGGYFMQESPYENDFVRGDLQGYSLGLGYDFGNFNLDLAYTIANIDRNDRLYQTDLARPASVSSNISNVFLTASFGF